MRVCVCVCVCGWATKCVNKAHLPPTWPHNETKLQEAGNIAATWSWVCVYGTGLNIE